MHRLFYIISILFLVSCASDNSIDNSAKPQTNPKKSFETCFANIDTSNTSQTSACISGTYKLVSDKYVIRIFPDFPIQFDSCYSITIDSINGQRFTELLVFDKNNASLTNICSDLTITNSPEPTRHLYAQSGQVIIGFSNPTELYGNKTHHTTVLIKNLIFIDKSTGEKIELKNELLWKVLNLGTPG